MNEAKFGNPKNEITVFHNKNEIPYISVPHIHSEHEIYYNIVGARGFMIDDELYSLSERNLVFIPRLHAHKAVVDKNAKYERLIINADDCIFKLACRTYPQINFFSSFEEIDAPKFANLTKEEHESLAKLIKNYNICEKNENGTPQTLSAFAEILRFIGTVLKNQNTCEKLPGKKISHVDRILKIAENNFKTATVSDIAANLYMNEDYITRIFKAETGLTLQSYLVMRKIAEAKKLLYMGKSVKEACLLSGFHNYANFIRTYKKYEGCPPGETDSLTKPV